MTSVDTEEARESREGRRTTPTVPAPTGRQGRPPRTALPPEQSLLPGASRRGFWLYLIPGFVLFTVIVLVPLIWNVYLSFTDYRGIRPPTWAGLDNWRELLVDDRFWTSFLNSVFLIIAMVVVPTVLGLLLAAMLFDLIGRKFGGRLASFLRATYYLPQILPVAIAAIVIGWILRPENGALNTVLDAIGLGALQHNWLGSPDTALLSIMVVMVWVQLGYPVVIFMAALQRVDPELYEAAELDGAGWFQRFRAITVSIIRPEIFVVVLTCTIAALKVFGPIYALTRGGPGDSTIVPSYYAYSEFFQSQQVGYGATIATALTLVIVVITIFFIQAQNRVERAERER
ncbi:carbohydrate ABC transporter permease [Frigoribacterium faeni]|uniref:ABC transporter permease n=1 Tax=Frigoribacterium faeni TaxID=145483 RepID=A0A7W3JJN9_9MICO|nr:sugar ABC transporter permease [Frigoribacterium faeni]MBA8814127.1 raffinose/stachyose/melibiose transport system permease protein [Frigoribacterium faeni]BFF16167.1 sugar ABC transporter permease [Microbacterium flavescens]GEK82719.1 ABC transporter permease [Frigoribacterium faeni]